MSGQGVGDKTASVSKFGKRDLAVIVARPASTLIERLLEEWGDPAAGSKALGLTCALVETRHVELRRQQLEKWNG